MIWLTLTFKRVVKKSLNLTFKSQFQSLKSSKSFWFFCYQKVIVYSNVFSLWLLFDNSQLTLVLKTPQVLLTCISGNEYSIQMLECKDIHPRKKCKKLKKKGKCKVEKISKKCELTCKKCTPGTLSLIIIILFFGPIVYSNNGNTVPNDIYRFWADWPLEGLGYVWHPEILIQNAIATLYINQIFLGLIS